MSLVKITTTGRVLTATVPYSAEFARAAREIGGVWSADAKSWSFDDRDEERVRELCRAMLGTSGAEDEAELITVHVMLNALPEHHFESDRDPRFPNRIRWCGRVLASRRSRDESVKLGHNVRLVSGTFESRGGSVSNPQLGEIEDIVLEVRDVPTMMFERLSNTDGVTVLDTVVDREALVAEREQLLARLATINAALGD